MKKKSLNQLNLEKEYREYADFFGTYLCSKLFGFILLPKIVVVSPNDFDEGEG